MPLVTFKLRNKDGSIPDEIVGRIQRDIGLVPVLGNILKLKSSIVKITQVIADGSDFIMIVDKFNPNAPYLNPLTLKKNRKYR